MSRLSTRWNRRLAAVGLLGWAYWAGQPSGLGWALEVTPGEFSFRGAPGTKHRGVLQVRNDSRAPLQVRVHGQSDAGRLSKDPPGWMRASAKRFQLKPGQTQRVPVAFSIPDLRGEIRGEVVVTGQDPANPWYEVRVRRPVVLRVLGTERAAGELAVEARQTGPSVVLEAVFTNTGNVTLQPKFVADIETPQGEKVTKIVDSTPATIPPGDAVTFSASVPVDGNQGAIREGRLWAFFKDAEGKVENVQRPFVVQRNAQD